FFYSLRIPCRTWLLFFSLPRSRPGSTLFPYTTLFRSGLTCLRLLCVELLHLCLDRACLLRIAVHLTEERQMPLRRSFRHGSLKQDRKSTRLNSSHGSISYAVFCLKKKISNKLQSSDVH